MTRVAYRQLIKDYVLRQTHQQTLTVVEWYSSPAQQWLYHSCFTDDSVALGGRGHVIDLPLPS